jgi:hypothetical protein
MKLSKIIAIALSAIAGILIIGTLIVKLAETGTEHLKSFNWAFGYEQNETEDNSFSWESPPI